MLIANPVGKNHSAFIRLDALHNTVNYSVVHNAWKQSVVQIRAAHPVRFNELHPQVIRLADIVPHGQNCESVAVHHVGKERKLLELVEVVHPVSVAQRAIRPQRELPENLHLQSVCLLRRHAQKLRVDLRRGSQSARHHVCPHGFQCTGRNGNAHVSVAAPFPQSLEVIFDVAFCIATGKLPAAHRFLGRGSTIVSVAGIDKFKTLSCRRAAQAPFRGDDSNRPVYEVHFCHVVLRQMSRITKRYILLRPLCSAASSSFTLLFQYSISPRTV